MDYSFNAFQLYFMSWVQKPCRYSCTGPLPCRQELANLLNGTGSKASFVERMRLIPTIEARWATERTQQNLKCRDAGYNGKLAEFLSKFFPQKFDSARDYAKASSVYNLLVTQKLWPSLERPGPCSDDRKLAGSQLASKGCGSQEKSSL